MRETRAPDPSGGHIGDLVRWVEVNKPKLRATELLSGYESALTPILGGIHRGW